MNNLVIVKSADFYGAQCDFWQNIDTEEYFMTTEQLGQCLGYEYPKQAISKILDRNSYLKDAEFSRVVKLGTVTGEKETRLFTEDGIYEITMLAKTDRAREFRGIVRKILKELRAAANNWPDQAIQPVIDEPITQAVVDEKLERARIMTYAARTFKRVLTPHRFQCIANQVMELLFDNSAFDGEGSLEAKWGSIHTFFAQCVNVTIGGGVTPKENLYLTYQDWCLQNRLTPASRQKMTQYIREMFPFAKERTNGIRKWTGIAITRKNTETQPPPQTAH